MKSLFLLVAAISLAGCVDPTAQQPQYNPAMAKLRQACDAGDTQACAAIVQAQSQQRMADAQFYSNIRLPQQQYLPPMTGGGVTTTNCRNNFGQITCTSY